jgi:hypothetical protein
MPSSVGPNTFGEENLVFGYDLGDVSNSYKGEPTVNYVPGTYGYSLYAYASGPVDTTVLNENNKSITAKRYTITNAVNTARAAIFPNGLTTGVAYTFSFKWKYNGTTTASPSIGVDASKGNPEGGANNNGFTSTTSSTVSIGNGWYLTTYTFVFSSNPTGACTLTFGINTGSNTSYIGETFDIYEAQFEIKDHRTQYSNGTRSATQGLLDLTGNSTINLSNVSFDSNAQMTFDGSNDYATLSSASHPTGSCSMEIVFNHTHNFVGSRYLLYGANGTAFWVFFRGDWAGNLLYFTRRVTNSGNYGDSAWEYTTGIYQPVPANETMHLIFTHDASSGEFKCYKNGILTRTVNGNLAAYGALNTTQQSHYIGGSPGDNLPMTLPLFKFYDRVLTASEIQSNFNAIKGRFNI